MKSKMQIFVLGLEDAGKTQTTSFFENIISNPIFQPNSLGKTMEWEIHKVRFHMWEKPDQAGFRKIWLRGIELADIFLFIIDTSKPDKFQQAKYDLEQFLHEIPSNQAPIIFHFHKMDLASAKTHYKLALEEFDDINLGTHPRLNLKTSIHQPETLQHSYTSIHRIFQNSSQLIKTGTESMLT